MLLLPVVRTSKKTDSVIKYLCATVSPIRDLATDLYITVQ